MLMKTSCFFRTISTFVIAGLSIGILAGCSNSGIQERQFDELNTEDAVLSVYAGNAGAEAWTHKGYLFLIDANGNGKRTSLTPVAGARLQWTSQGLFAPAFSHELYVDDSTAQHIERSVDSDFQVNRSADTQTSAALYSGRESHSVVVTNGTGTIIGQSENVGLFQQGVQCGDVFLGIANTEFNPHLIDAAAEQSGDTEASGYDFLARLHPHDGTTPPILAATSEDRSVRIGPWEPACVDRRVISPVFKRDHPDASRDNGQDPNAGHLALQTWDADSGERQIISMTREDGTLLTLSPDDSYSNASQFSGSTYRFVTNTGRVLAVEVMSGRVIQDFTIPLETRELSTAAFYITEKHCYVLSIPSDAVAPPSLSAYDLDTGEGRELMTLPSLRSHLGGNWMTGELFVESIAIRPSYDQQLTAAETPTSK